MTVCNRNSIARLRTRNYAVSILQSGKFSILRRFPKLNTLEADQVLASFQVDWERENGKLIRICGVPAEHKIAHLMHLAHTLVAVSSTSLNFSRRDEIWFWQLLRKVLVSTTIFEW